MEWTLGVVATDESLTTCETNNTIYVNYLDLNKTKSEKKIGNSLKLRTACILTD